MNLKLNLKSLMIGGLILAGAASAADTLPAFISFVFQPGTPIRASEVNQNFANLSAEIGKFEAAPLKDASVTTAKLADNAVTGSKVQNASLASAKLSDGPGIAAQLTLNKTTLLTSSDMVSDTVTLKAPGAGFIVLEASGTVVVPNNDADVAQISISTSTTKDFNYLTSVSVSPALPVSLMTPFALDRVEAVPAAGTYTFNLVASTTANTNLTQLYAPHLIAMYFPAAYGAVSTN